MRFITVFPVLIFLALAGCASKSDLDYLRSDVEELKTRLPNMEKQLGTLRSETREGLEKNVGSLHTDLATLRKGTADLQANVEAMKVDMQVVAGKMDDATLAAKKPADDITLLRDDVERRLAAIDVRISKLEKGLEEQKKVAETPESVYQSGVNAARSGDPQKAREVLTKFLELYPSHDMAANAHYWLGESYYNEKKYDQAVLEFQEVIKKYPDKEKVPAAMLKQGMAFKEMGDAKSARYLFKKLGEQFPNADETKIAKEKLKDLK